MEEFIKIRNGIEIRPKFVVRKETRVCNGEYTYYIKVLGDKEYEVSEETFNKIK